MSYPFAENDVLAKLFLELGVEEFNPTTKALGQSAGRALSFPADIAAWTAASKAGDALMPQRLGRGMPAVQQTQQAFRPPMMAPPSMRFPVNRGGPLS